MIMNQNVLSLIYHNPISTSDDVLNIDYPNIDYMDFKRTYEYNTDNDICKILDNIIKDLNCTIEYSYGRPMMTTNFNYKTHMSNYYRYLLKLTNQLLYNKYIDKIIQRHIDNIVFEYEHPYIHPIKNKKESKKKNLPPNTYIRRITHDMFTGEEVYSYYNPCTKDEINSSNPNLLAELNTPKKKERKKSIKIKSAGVPISAMTFSFKKK